MAGPMYLLYEGCILIAWLMERRVRRQSLMANSTRA
jgi:Sec-independent protein secretion pathway component TatC